MTSLLLCIWWLFMAICDFFNLKPFRGFEKYLAKEQTRKYRIFRGIFYLLFAGILFGIFYAERILKIDLSLGEAFLWYGIPCLIPLVGLIALNTKYDLPPFQEEK